MVQSDLQAFLWQILCSSSRVVDKHYVLGCDLLARCKFPNPSATQHILGPGFAARSSASQCCPGLFTTLTLEVINSGRVVPPAIECVLSLRFAGSLVQDGSLAKS